MNSLGRILRLEIFGESHGPAVGFVLDGVPPGLPIAQGDFDADLARRRAGGAGSTGRVEADVPEFLSGLYRGRTTGTPLAAIFRNGDARPSDYEDFERRPRPGHADLVGHVRYRGFSDPRGGGHFSGRLSLPLVTAGVIAKKLLPECAFMTRILEAGGEADVEKAVAKARAAGDSVGALVELRVSGVPAGLGEPFFGSVEGEVARAIFAVPGVRGIEFGDGFRAARMRGSEHNDPILSASGLTAKNGAGGINGGVTNGNELVLRVAMKPASTIARPQMTVDLARGAPAELSAGGRHDACIALRGAVALEAALALVLADFALLARSHDAAAAIETPGAGA